MSHTDFCTCDDFDCPFHPKHQNNECRACIAKNIENHEIPACFWKQIGKKTGDSNYTFYKFAKKVMIEEKV